MTDDVAPPAGECVVLRPGIRRILAPNPSMMTQNGTNTYIVGSGHVAVIDPGPAIDAHLDAILAALSPGERVSHILVTHAHLDHSALAPRLAGITGAAVYGYGDAESGRSETMKRLPTGPFAGGGEGADRGFSPDFTLSHGARVANDSWDLMAIHTPGHFGNHLCFASGDILFTGDHIMGWSTSLISPPDGDMTDYMASLRKIASATWSMLLPAHGDPVHTPAQRIADLIAHRLAREATLLAAVQSGISAIDALTLWVYPDLAPALLPAARRNIFAHLIDLSTRNVIQATPYLSENATFTAR